MELKVLDNGQKIKYIPNFDEQNYPICRLNWINSSHTFSLKPANQDLKSVQSIWANEYDKRVLTLWVPM